MASSRKKKILEAAKMASQGGLVLLFAAIVGRVLEKNGVGSDDPTIGFSIGIFLGCILGAFVFDLQSESSESFWNKIGYVFLTVVTFLMFVALPALMAFMLWRLAA